MAITIMRDATFDDDMARQAHGRVFSSGEARTLYVSVPSHVATDSAFPFADGETVLVRIEDGNIAIAPAEDGAGDGA